MDIATRAGQDSGCNPSSAAGILGTLIGYDRIPAVYTDELVKVENRPFNQSMSFQEGCRMSYQLALDCIETNGGTVTDDQLRIRLQKLQPVRYEESFEGVALDQKVRDVITCKNAEASSMVRDEKQVEARPILPVTGSFMNLAYKDVRNKYINPVDSDTDDPVLWETKVRELHGMGMEYLILMEVANDGKSYYPSQLMEPQYDENKKSPVETILDEAGKLGMKVFLSTGWAQNQDDDLRIPAIKERQLQIMDEIGTLYNEKEAFYGWYLPVEDCINPIFPKHAVDVVNVLVEKAHELTPGKKTLISPYGLGLSGFDDPEYEKTLSQLKVDIIAYQDEVDCVREPTPLPELKRNWKRLRKVHDKIGIEMWANCENFTWEKGTNDP